jgi:anti-sigma factor ChrR (cupin superfamily)
MEANEECKHRVKRTGCVGGVTLAEHFPSKHEALSLEYSCAMNLCVLGKDT